MSPYDRFLRTLNNRAHAVQRPWVTSAVTLRVLRTHPESEAHAAALEEYEFHLGYVETLSE